MHHFLRLRLRRRALVAAMAAGFAGHAAAQATGMQAIHGSAQLSQQGQNLVITTSNGAGTRHSALDWQGFSVPAGTVARFDQPSADSLSINRVLGASPSQILGTLQSNGRLVLVNPAGIAVGAGAVVDTAGFTASTLRLAEIDALAARLRFGDGEAASAGALRVDGRIVARHGDLVLVAPSVATGPQALLQSPEGATVLAAGQRVEITGPGLEGVALQLQAPSDQALNLGRLEGGAVAMFAASLRHSGAIQATSATREGGRVLLRAGGDAEVDGAVAAQAQDRGGAIDVFGQRVHLAGTALLDASGAAGGGSIRVGGGFQGRDASAVNADETRVDAGSVLRADATGQGSGGRVIVWSDGRTRSAGAISARGGPGGGDGGFVEVSGKRWLGFGSTVDTRAPLGRQGTLLLDPEDILVVAGSGTVSDLNDVADPSLPGTDAGGTTSTVSASLLNGASTDITLQATHSIRFQAVDLQLQGNFTAQAGTSITLNDVTLQTPGTVTFIADDLSNQGRFRVDGTVRAGLNSTLVNESAGTIYGTGTLDLFDSTLVNRGVIAPGDAGAAGTLTLAHVHALQNQAGAALRFTADGAQLSRLDVQPGITSFAPGSAVELQVASGPAAGTYTLLSGITDPATLPQLVGGGTGWSLSHGSLLLTVPPPHHLLLLHRRPRRRLRRPLRRRLRPRNPP